MKQTKNTEKPDNLKDQIDKSAKLFDVAQPGKTAAGATSRPVIVGHKAQTKRDPMVVEKTEESKEDDKPVEEVLQPKRKTVIAPLNQPADSDDKTEDSASELPTEENKTEPEELAGIKKEEPAKEKEATVNARSNINALANTVDSKQALKKEQKEEEDKSQEIEELINSKKYYVPIGQVTRKRKLHAAIIILLVLIILALVGVNFALDADMIDVNVEPLTDIF